ncbi:hypothetical protein GCM10007301_44630 [Azorhizobium oxalatiphilum]|uniref:DNA repair protein MmcB-related protein n=1 Tax=Azorhizobium oxalatiphilum TaxID=980631 RepID=A0A917CA62_9HYPH|nr:MmcB family DNA repair protein [Azorhizobium oxalatiphilum]GGF79643.1 hypothetical protein GCM10007301_44630 [Azorhizobium oxalatiphilum]
MSVEFPIPKPDGRQSVTAQALQRGVLRHLVAHGLFGLPEFSLVSGRRADIIALDGKGQVTIIEIKSSVIDFRTDTKWPEYRAYCDRLIFAVSLDFPIEILPDEVGILVGDAFGAEMIRQPPVHALPAATRKALTLRFARAAAGRLTALYDPDMRPAIDW